MGVYGDLDTVRQMLRPTSDSDLGADADSHLSMIQVAVSATIEFKTGRSFGEPVDDTEQLVWGGYDSVLLLPQPARAITSVSVGGNVEGGVVTDGDEWESNQWSHYPVDRDSGAIYGLILLSGGSWGHEDAHGRPLMPVVVTGDFTNTDDDVVVPDDITHAANFLISERFKAETASPAGFIGPDGAVVPIRDPWADPLVMQILKRHSIGSRELVV